jgi:hypothetical protein
MTTLVFNFRHEGGKCVVASNQFTVAACVDGHCTLDGHGLMGERVIIYCTMDEFLALIAEGGKIVDLRKLQEEK